MTFQIIGVSVLLAMGLSLGAATLPAIQGEYLEVRSNHVYTCACRYSGEQVTGGREAFLVWVFQAGEFRGTPLAGAKVVAVVQGEDNLSLESTARKSVVFLEGVDSEAGREALVELLWRQYGKALGGILRVHPAPISFQKEAGRVIVTVGEISRLVVRPARLPEDAHQGSLLWYDPFIPTAESMLGTTEYQRFSGSDFRHQWWENDSGITGYIGTFAFSQ